MHRVGRANSTLDAINNEDWHDRAEDLVHNYRVVLILYLNHGDFHEILRLIHLSPNKYLASCFIEHLFDSLEVPLIHYSGVVLAVLLPIRVEFFERNLQLFDKLWENFPFYHDIILAHTHLASIEELSP